MVNGLSLIAHVRGLARLVNRLPTSIKKDVQGLSQKEKRVLNNKIETIYKELVVLNRQTIETLESLTKKNKEN